MLLVQEAIYICNLGTKDEVRKRERLVMSEAEDTEDADPGECQVRVYFLKPDWAQIYFIPVPGSITSFYQCFKKSTLLLNIWQGYDLTLRVDENMPLTHYPWCEFINMGYYIHAVARTHSFYDDIVVKLPLIIEPLASDLSLLICLPRNCQMT